MNFKQLIGNNYVILIIVIAVYVIAAVNLVGYFHPDEHYQIIEFAQYKLGKIDAGQMPWEFNYEMRSSFQPWIAYSIIKFLNIFGSANPYQASLLLRLITASLTIYSIHRFIKITESELSHTYRLYYKWFSYFLWFLPILDIRFNSETCSGIFFLLAVSYLIPNNKQNYKYAIIGGLLCGFSYLCRFQSGIMTFGLMLWLLIIQRRNYKHIIVLLVSVLSVIVLGVYLDYLYYGDWTLSFWNYFNMNILYDMASDFGAMSIYAYSQSLINSAFPPIGILIAFCFIVFIAKMPKSFVVWCMLPLIILHILVPHKEVRFMFPILNFLPFVIIKSVSLIASQFQTAFISFRQKFILKFFLVLIIIINFLCLFMTINTPPVFGRIAVTQYIYDHYSNKPIKLYSLKRNNPYNPIPFLRQSFYEMKNVHYNQLQNYDTLQTMAFPSTNSLLVIRRHDLEDTTISKLVEQSQIKILKTGNARWVDAVRNFVDFTDEGEYILCKFPNER